MQTTQDDQSRDLRYYLAGTGHIFDKAHALESLERLRSMDARCCQDIAAILHETMENPRKFTSPSARITTCAALLLLYEWNYSGLFDIIKRLCADEHELGKDITLSDMLDLYPQMLHRCKSFAERVGLVQAADTDKELKVLCLDSLIISALHDATLSPQTMELCYSLWQKKTPKTPDLWARALLGSIQLGDKKRTDAMLKAAKNNQLSEFERRSILAAIQVLKESSVEEYLLESKRVKELQLSGDIAAAFANIELFDSVPEFGETTGLKMKREPDDETPSRFFVFDVTMQHDDFSTEIRIADNLSFYQLHEAILASLEWDDDHLFAFYLDNKFHRSQAVIDGDPETNGAFADDVLLSEAKLKEGQKIAYLFDFGDNHEFVLTIRRIESFDPSEKAHEFDYEVITRDVPPPQYADF